MSCRLFTLARSSQDLPIKIKPKNACVWVGACDAFGAEATVQCTTTSAAPDTAVCTCRDGFALDGGKCVASANGNSTASTTTTTTTIGVKTDVTTTIAAGVNGNEAVSLLASSAALLSFLIATLIV